MSERYHGDNNKHFLCQKSLLVTFWFKRHSWSGKIWTGQKLAKNVLPSLTTVCKIGFWLSICCLKLLPPSEAVYGFRCCKMKREALSIGQVTLTKSGVYGSVMRIQPMWSYSPQSMNLLEGNISILTRKFPVFVNEDWIVLSCRTKLPVKTNPFLL
jgi:hypothetical protein